jgi:lipopolysaccharide export system protein LptA
VKSFKLAIIPIFLTQTLLAQNLSPGKLSLLHADSARSFEENGRIIRELLGAVKFAQDSMEMVCDRARQIPHEQKTIFSGNVQIRDGQRWLRAEKVIYYEKHKTQEAFGNVMLGSGPNQLRAKRVAYFQKERLAVADSEVVMTNSERRLQLTCGHLEYHRDEEYSRAMINPVLVEFDSSNAEVLNITGEQIEVFESGKRAKASKQVRIVRRDTHAECEEAEYFRDTERLELRIKPVTWQGGDKLTGDRIDLFLRDQKLIGAHVINNAVVTSVVDTLKIGKRTNTLSGREMTVSFRDEKMERIVVEGTATSFYNVIEEGEDKGRVRVQGDKITLLITDQNLRRVIIESKPGTSTGRFLPVGITEESKSK